MSRAISDHINMNGLKLENLSGVVDATTIEQDATTGKIRVKDASVSAAKIATDAVTATKILDASVIASKLDSTSKTAVLQSKNAGRYVQAADQASPNATSVAVTTLLGFGTVAGVDPEGTAKGKCCLLEAIGGTEYNTTTNKTGSSAKARSSKCPIIDLNGNEITDTTGKTVWGIITATARTTVGVYTLRFYSGEFGSGAEVAYSMAQGFQFAYPQIFDLSDMPLWVDEAAILVDKEAAALAPGQIGTVELADLSVTTAKIAANAVTKAKVGGDFLASSTVAEAKSAADVAVTPSALVNFAITKNGEITGNGSALSFTFTHGLNKRGVIAYVYDFDSPYQEQVLTKKNTDLNNVTIEFGAAPANLKKYTVVVIG